MPVDIESLFSGVIMEHHNFQHWILTVFWLSIPTIINIAGLTPCLAKQFDTCIIFILFWCILNAILGQFMLSFYNKIIDYSCIFIYQYLYNIKQYSHTNSISEKSWSKYKQKSIAIYLHMKICQHYNAKQIWS